MKKSDKITLNGLLKKNLPLIITILILIVSFAYSYALLSAEVDDNTSIIRENSQDIRKNREDISEIAGDIKEIKAILYRMERRDEYRYKGE